MRAIAIFAALVPLLTLPAMADRAAVDKCKADADKTIASIKEQMRLGYSTDDSGKLDAQHREATRKRAACDSKPADPA
jgi:hypothetical protein